MNRNDTYYVMIKKFQEQSENHFIKNFDTDDVYYLLSRQIIRVMQEHFDTSSHQQLKDRLNSTMEKYFSFLEKESKQ